MEIIKLRDEFIKLGQALKAARRRSGGKIRYSGWSRNRKWRSRYKKRQETV